jgi:hypothetical protein
MELCLSFLTILAHAFRLQRIEFLSQPHVLVRQLHVSLLQSLDLLVLVANTAFLLLSLLDQGIQHISQCVLVSLR